MAFDPAQLDQIRQAIKVSDVVGKRFKLRRQGTEFVVVDNASFTINDSKGIWKEFGNGGSEKAGDVFDFLQHYEGFTFVGAVEELAKQTGIVLASRPGRSSSAASGSGAAQASDKPDDRADDDAGREVGNDWTQGGAGGRTASAAGKSHIVASWDIVDPEGNLLYQVVRLQKQNPDGSWQKNSQGKIWKSIGQRRPSPDGDGTWLWGLDVIDRKTQEPLQFCRWRSDSDWYRATPDRLAKGNPEVRSFESAGNVDHWLYNANDVIDELQEPPDEQRPIFFPEGEKKVDALKEWGLLAVCNTGGAGHFTPEMAAFFRNAGRVIFLQDNDRAGAERVAKIAPQLKAQGVKSIQSLNFRDVWPKCPVKGDVVDWRDEGGGTRDQLLEITDGLKEWLPEPYKSKFGAKRASDLQGKPSPYPWRIKFIVPRDDNLLIMGPSRSGKTFEALDMAMHCHFSLDFAGKKVTPCGFVYLTYEGATGFENRLRAYMQHHRLTQEDMHSFAWLTRPPGLYASEDNVLALAHEISEIAKGFRLPLGATIVDTHNSATRGSSEIKSEDIDKILSRYAILQERTAAPLWIIGHTNNEGRHRGNEQFFNGIEAVLLVQRVQEIQKGKQPIDLRDQDGRVLRRVSVNKQREGDDNIRWDFVLQRVEIGTDEDGDPIPSMVSVEPTRHADDAQKTDKRDRPAGYSLSAVEAAIFRAMLDALEEHGVPPPPALGLPASVTKVLNTRDLGTAYREKNPPDEGESHDKYYGRMKARLRRFHEVLTPYNVVGMRTLPDPADPTKVVAYIWPTGRAVYGRALQWPKAPPKRKDSPKPTLAPGETEDDAAGALAPKTVF